MRSVSGRPPQFSLRIGVCLVAGAALIFTVYGYYLFEASYARSAGHDALATISELKSDQISQWRSARLRDVTLTARAAEAIRLRAVDPSNGTAAPELRNLLDSLASMGYANAAVVTPGDSDVGSSPNLTPTRPVALTEVLKLAVATGRATLSDLYRCDNDRICITAVAPIRDAAGQPVAVMQLESNASSQLFPLIRYWPTPSSSGETLIVSRNGQDVVFLNDLRHQANAALRMRRPLSSTDLPAAQAVLGRTGAVDGTDYRGVAVATNILAVPDSPWFVVSKMDASEVLSEARWRTAAVATVFTLTLLLVWAVYTSLERKRRADLFRARFEFVEQAEEVGALGTFEFDLVANRWTSSPNLDRMFGLDARLARTFQGWASILHPEDREETSGYLQTVIAAKGEFDREYRVVRPSDGAVRWVHGRGRVESGPAGDALRMIGTIQDITERRQRREERAAHIMQVRRQRDVLTKLAMTGPPIRPEDMTGGFSQITEGAARTLGIARASVWRFSADRTRIQCADLFELGDDRHTSGAELLAAHYPTYFKAIGDAQVIDAHNAHDDYRTAEFAEGYLAPLGITSMLDVPIRLGGVADGVLCCEHIGPPRTWTSEEITFAVALAHLLSLALEGMERARVEIALRETLEAQRLQVTALNAAADAVVITDPAGRIEWVNAAFSATSGYSAEEALGKNPRELMKSGAQDAAYYRDLWATITAGRVWRGELLNRRKDGSTYPEEMTITPVPDANGGLAHFVAIKRDVTEEKKLEARFMQAQKMEVVGRLAGGVAHDFNNLLTVINGTADLAQSDLADDHPLAQDLRTIHDAGERAAVLTAQLLAFSRKQILKREVVRPGQLVAGMQGLIRRLIGEDITLSVSASEEGKILVDAGQFSQVVMNLAVNARDAMPTGGSLTIQTSDTDVDDGFVGSHPAASTGPHVMLTISDTGSGMDETVKARLFEPFFTTKEAGKGTGLGLSTVYGIVKQSGGTIWVYSEPGQGTVFKVLIPRTDQSAQAPVAAGTPRREGGRETILLVEDAVDLRQLAARILRGAGYEVIEGGTGPEALALLAARKPPVHLLLTDVVLPEMTGRELADRVTKHDPGIKVLYTSGYIDDSVLRHGVAANDTQFIAKPYSAAGLRRKVRDVLDSLRSEAND